MSKIKVGIVGVGNCAKSLVEGIQYYNSNPEDKVGVIFAVTVETLNSEEVKSLLNENQRKQVEKFCEDTESVDEVREVLTKMMWGNCKSCHSKFRAPH